jgi:hypothetical protein
VLLLVNGVSVAKSSHEEVTRLLLAQPSRVYAITCKQVKKNVGGNHRNSGHV